MTAATLPDVLAEIERAEHAKRDFVASTAALEFERDDDHGFGLWIPDEGTDAFFPLRELAHKQLGTHYKIPRDYYTRLEAEHQPLLADTVNYFLSKVPAQRMIRTLDGDVRAFLSNRYVARDNYDLMVNAVLPTVERMPDAEIRDLRLTENRLYAKVLLPRVTAEVKVGDEVQAGFIVSNSEVGQGAFSVEIMVWRLICSNGMIAPQAMRKIHTGARAAETEAAYEVFSDQTLMADDKAFWLKARDIVAAAADETRFRAIVSQMEELAETDPMADPAKGVERLVKRFGFRDSEGEGIYRHLLEGGDLTAYGTLNAITRTAQDVEDYDRQIELERAGGDMLELPEREWVALAA